MNTPPIPYPIVGIELPDGYKFIHSKFAAPSIILIQRPDGEIGWLDTEKKVCVNLPNLADEIETLGRIKQAIEEWRGGKE